MVATRAQLESFDAAAQMIPIADIRAARARIETRVQRTELAPSETLSALHGRDLWLKYENHQFTASFKERGALNKLLLLNEEQRYTGVVAASAGNHAQALARHCALLDIPAYVIMPKFTPNTKVQNTKIFGATVLLVGEKVDESMECAAEFAEEFGLALVHPFDDQEVIAGQGTIGIELLEQNPEIDTIVVPIGGGGLIAGVASAAKQIKPSVRVIGVQVNTFNTAYARFHGLQPTEKKSAITIAEGIAVKRPGAITGPMIESLLDDVVEVSERDIETAVFDLLEIEKTVVEGAGAASLAAVDAHPEIANGTTALILTGGNIDMMTLASVLQRGLVRTSRLVQLRVMLPDIPGSLATLANYLGELDSNIVDISHRRMHPTSSLSAQPTDILVHLCGEEQTSSVVNALRSRGYDVSVLVD